MSPDRTAIPADIERRVKIEAGHRCAIATCRHIEIEIHHIVPWEKCRAHEYDNLIALCPNCHARADRGDIDRKSLMFYKSSLRLAHDRFSQFEVDVLFEAFKQPGTMAFPAFMDLLIKRLLDSKFIELTISRFNKGGFFDPRPNHPNEIQITAEGRRYVESLGILPIDDAHPPATTR